MSSAIRPAELAFDASGAPFSAEFGDVYHSRESGPGQAAHVFLHGNDLPGRWHNARVFTIVETGFGIGLNFLATWDAWQKDAWRSERLHFVSIERHPFCQRDLQQLHARYPQFAALAQALHAQWPPAVSGVHRRHFADGRVTLTLAFGDVGTVVRELRVAADAFYLDGFAPDRNPDMWSPPVMKSLARLALPGATFATYTTARPVRDALTAAGFAHTKRPGFAPKRDMLSGRYAPTWPTRRALPVPPHWPERHAMVIGAGLAGAAAAQCLAARGWRIDVVERRSAPANGPSGLHAGVFQPHVSIDDGVFSRLTRAGFLYALAQWNAAETGGLPMSWGRCGVLTLADDDAHAQRMEDAFARLQFPTEFARAVSRIDASVLAGRDVAMGGWWCADAGWMRPSALVRTQLRGLDAARVHLRNDVTAMERTAAGWEARDATGAVIAQAPVVILANSHDALRLADFGPTAAQIVRGQLTYLPAPPFAAPRSVVCGNGYVLPAIEGIAVAGASFERDNADPRPDVASHAANLARAERLLPGCSSGFDPAAVQGAVGFRCAAADRLPMIGPVVDVAAARATASELKGAHLLHLPRIPGLYAAFAYASRGLVWASLAAELLACQLDGEPLPMERALVDAVDPGRFILKRVRRGTL